MQITPKAGFLFHATSHGHDPIRPIQTGIGPVEVAKPKARDRGAATADERIRYASSILPKWARRTKSLDVLLPALYLRGISTGVQVKGRFSRGRTDSLPGTRAFIGEQ